MTITELPRRLRDALPTRTPSERRPDPAASLPPARGSGFARGFVAMRHPNYRRYWFGQIGSLVGAWMQSVALPWLVLQLGGSPLQLGLVMAFMFGPSLFLAPLGGVLADRLDKRRTLLVVNVVAMAQATTLFVLAATGAVEIWQVYLLALVAGFVNAVEMPVRQAFVAELVPRDDLVNAIALSSTSFNLSRVIGPAIAGVTIAAFGVASNFGVNALSYLSVIVGLLLIRTDALHRAPRPVVLPSIRASLAEGLRYARATPTVLWPLVLLGGVAALAMNFQTLLPIFSRDTLGLDSGGYGALFAAMGAGSLAGLADAGLRDEPAPAGQAHPGRRRSIPGHALRVRLRPHAVRGVRAGRRHRLCLDADGEHDQRHHPELDPRRAPRPGDVAVRHGVRRVRPDRRPAGRRHGPGLGRIRGVQRRCGPRRRACSASWHGSCVAWRCRRLDSARSRCKVIDRVR